MINLKENKVTNSTKIFILRNKNLLEIDPSGEIIDYFVNDPNPKVRIEFCKRTDFLEICPSDLVRELSLDVDEEVRTRVVDHIHPRYKDATYLYSVFLMDDSPKVRAALAVKGDQLVDDTLDVEKYYFTKKLLLDKNISVIKSLLSWLSIDSLKNTDPNCEILLDLAAEFGVSEADYDIDFLNKEEYDIKYYEILLEKIMEITSEESFAKGEAGYLNIFKMAKHPKKDIRLFVAYRADLLEIDPEGNIVFMLAQDEDKEVRDAIKYNDNKEYDAYSGLHLDETLYENLLKKYILLLIK